VARGLERRARHCSDLLRARETAELVGWPAAEPDVRWREIDVGDWTGVHAHLVRDEEKDAYRAWREGRLAAYNTAGDGHEGPWP
jgi:broad specificity phosphatase PhoE